MLKKYRDKAFSTHCQLCGEEILDEEAFYFDDGSYFIRGYCIHQVCAEEQTPNMPGYTKLRNEMRENMTLINPLQEKDSVKKRLKRIRTEKLASAKGSTLEEILSRL